MNCKNLEPLTDDCGNRWYPCIPKTKFYCYMKIRTKINGEDRAFFVYKTEWAKQFKKGELK